MAKITIIACVSRDRGLGKDGDLLWKIPQDQEFFKKMTTGHSVVMGRKTYESIGRPLPDRENIVLSHEKVEGDVKWMQDVDELRKHLDGIDGEVFIIGGASLYEMFLPDSETLYLTEIDNTKPADTFFPQFNASKYDCKVLQSGVHDNSYYDIVRYERKDD